MSMEPEWVDDWASDRDRTSGLEGEKLEEAFTITDDSAATWALRKVARAEAEVARVLAVANAEIARINQWKADACRGPVDDIGFFKAHLVDYRHRLEDLDPKLPKTYKLPAGELTCRKGPSRVEVVDEEAFVAWAEANDPELLSRKPLVSRLKDGYRPVPPDGDESVERVTSIVTGTGEVVPGVRQVYEPERYGVKTR